MPTIVVHSHTENPLPIGTIVHPNRVLRVPSFFIGTMYSRIQTFFVHDFIVVIGFRQIPRLRTIVNKNLEPWLNSNINDSNKNIRVLFRWSEHIFDRRSRDPNSGGAIPPDPQVSVSGRLVRTPAHFAQRRVESRATEPTGCPDT